jgi:hypothetical protein
MSLIYELYTIQYKTPKKHKKRKKKKKRASNDITIILSSKSIGDFSLVICLDYC